MAYVAAAAAAVVVVAVATLVDAAVAYVGAADIAAADVVVVAAAAAASVAYVGAPVMAFCNLMFFFEQFSSTDDKILKKYIFLKVILSKNAISTIQIFASSVENKAVAMKKQQRKQTKLIYRYTLFYGE